MIEPLDEQRRNNPMRPSRVDAEAGEMAQSADPVETQERLEAADPTER